MEKKFLGISEDVAFAISVIGIILGVASAIYSISVNMKREKLIKKADEHLNEQIKALATV